MITRVAKEERESRARIKIISRRQTSEVEKVIYALCPFGLFICIYKYRCETRTRGETLFPQSIKNIGETLLRCDIGFFPAFISSSREFSIPFFPRSTIVLKLSAPELVPFLSHCPRQDYREVRERKSFEKQPRACCSFYLSLSLSFLFLSSLPV